MNSGNVDAKFRTQFLGKHEHLPVDVEAIFDGLNWGSQEAKIKSESLDATAFITCRATPRTMKALGERLFPFHQSMLDLNIHAVFPFARTLTYFEFK